MREYIELWMFINIAKELLKERIVEFNKTPSQKYNTPSVLWSQDEFFSGQNQSGFCLLILLLRTYLL